MCSAFCTLGRHVVAAARARKEHSESFHVSPRPCRQLTPCMWSSTDTNPPSECSERVLYMKYSPHTQSAHYIGRGERPLARGERRGVGRNGSGGGPGWWPVHAWPRLRSAWGRGRPEVVVVSSSGVSPACSRLPRRSQICSSTVPASRSHDWLTRWPHTPDTRACGPHLSRVIPCSPGTAHAHFCARTAPTQGFRFNLRAGEMCQLLMQLLLAYRR